MEPRISITNFEGDTPADIAQQLKVAAQPNTFFLFWGSPTARDSDITTVLDALPTGISCIGASTGYRISQVRPHSPRWTAVSISSAYMTAHSSFATLDPSDNPLDTSPVTNCVDKFSSTLKEHAPEYFDVYHMGGERAGAHDVKYQRPAFVLLFLPGRSSPINGQWPGINRDYQIVDALALRLSHEVVLFGASAGGLNLPGNSESRAWLAISNSRERRIIRGGMVGLLIETDLKFASGYDHGFTLSTKDESFPVQTLDKQWEINEPIEFRQDRPPRGHGIFELEDDNQHPDFVYHTLNEPDQDTTASTVNHECHMLAVYDGGDPFPNPFYDLPKFQQKIFVRPVFRGTTLHHVTAHRESVVDAVPKAVKKALKAGKIEQPAGILLIGCQGHLDKFGRDVPLQEITKLKELFDGPPPKLFGMYGIGETCPSEKGINLHRNWTTSALVLSNDFNSSYDSAARVHLLNRVDQDIQSPHSSERKLPVLDTLIETTRILTNAECHLRILSEDGKHLEAQPAPHSIVSSDITKIDISDNSETNTLMSYCSFRNRKPLIYSGAEYLANVKQWWPEHRAKDMEAIKWWASFPILDMGESIGTLTIHSNDPLFLKDKEAQTRITTIATEIVARAARTIRVSLMREALVRTLMDAPRADNPEELGASIVNIAARLVGRNAYLSLMLLSPENPRRLITVAIKGPEPINKDTMNKMTLSLDGLPSDCGIYGWVFQKREAYATDNVLEANGKDGKPQYRNFIPGMTANYAVPLIDPDNEEDVLGVLGAEAEDNVLHQELHMEVLKKLAQACVTSIRRHKLESELWKHLQSLLPRHIHENLKNHLGQGLEKVATPTRKFVTILYADIRNYTTMSQIIGEEQLSTFLNDYYNMVANEIGATNGTLDKFMGDGIVALYGDFDNIYAVNEENDDSILHAIRRAVEAGLSIAENFKILTNTWLPKWRREFPEVRVRDHRFEIGVAIHTGKPMVGLFQTKNPPNHLTYTAIGRDVNLAARVGNQVNGNSVWVTATTWQYLQSIPTFQFGESVLFSELKGVSLPIESFQVTKKPS